MSHRTLVNGTGYDIIGGRTLIGGTGYDVKSGRTLIGGTGYDVGFLPPIGTPLNSMSWEDIRKISDAGLASSYFSVGDEKQIIINGAVGNTVFTNLAINVFIIGINHNATYEGNNRIHFQLGKINGVHVVLADVNYGISTYVTGHFNMNISNTNVGGWNDSYARKILLGNTGSPTSPPSGSLLAALPSGLRAVMKSVTKYSDNTGGSSNTASYVTSTTDWLFHLAEFEYHGARTYANSAEKNYQTQYDYYISSNSKIKYKHNAMSEAAYAWCRSISTSSYEHFCLLRTNGSAFHTRATSVHSIAPGFCV